MNRELKILFDERKIEIPFPQMVVTEYKLNPTPGPIIDLTAHQEKLEAERVQKRRKVLEAKQDVDFGEDEDDSK